MTVPKKRGLYQPSPPKILLKFELRRWREGNSYERLGETSLTLDGRRLMLSEAVRLVCQLFQAPVPKHTQDRCKKLDKEQLRVIDELPAERKLHSLLDSPTSNLTKRRRAKREPLD